MNRFKKIALQLKALANDLGFFAPTDAPQNYNLPGCEAWFEYSGGKKTIYLTIDAGEDDLVMLDDYKFEYMKYLELILERTYSETTNNDACSYTYNFETQHLAGPVTISIEITDYFS